MMELYVNPCNIGKEIKEEIEELLYGVCDSISFIGKKDSDIEIYESWKGSEPYYVLNVNNIFEGEFSSDYIEKFFNILELY